MARKLSRRQIALYIATQLHKGAAMKQVINQLAAYLVDTRRTSELELIVRDIQFYLSKEGVVSGTVTSAHELNAATLKAIEVFTKDRTGAKTVSLDTQVDASLLGGVKLEIPGHELDTTAARKLTILKTRYKKA